MLHCFLLRLVEDAGILTDCSIKTQEPEDLLDFDFSGESVENKIIMKVKLNSLTIIWFRIIFEVNEYSAYCPKSVNFLLL